MYPLRTLAALAAVTTLAAWIGLAASSATTTALAAQGALTQPPAADHGASLPAGDGCRAQLTSPGIWTVICDDSGSMPGAPGSPGDGRSSALVCGLTPLSALQLTFLGLPKPPRGEHWAAITCTGDQPFGGVVLVGRPGRPAVTPAELLQVAIGRLHVPALPAGTAPPRGKPGLVGLPEWFWVPSRRWHPVSVTVTAGPVRATATATPVRLTFSPGAGLAGASCSGPGAAFRRAAAGQQTSCSYTYDQSSAGQQHGAYQAEVIVGWRVSWTGSGGAGGILNPDLQVADPVAVRVAEGQALVTSR
jgi:hypothetical protein